MPCNRDQARKKALKTKSVEDFNIYKRLQKYVTSRLGKAKSDFFQRKLDDCHGDPKAFWKLIKKVLPSKNRTTKIDKLVVDGVDIVDPKDISDSLDLHFTSVATNLLSARSHTTTSHHDPPSQFPSSLESSSPTKFHFRPTTDVEISNMLANLNPNKATGNDNIPAKILKISSNCIYQSLSCIVNNSLRLEFFQIDGKLPKFHLFSREI